MNKFVILAAALVAFGLCAFAVIVGLNIVPSKAVLTERQLVATWYVVWTMIWAAVLTGVGIGVFLLRAAMGDNRASAH